jgi:hypothetical protein
MKKALTLVVLIVTPSIVFAQGTVAFENSLTGLVQRWTSSNDSTLAPVPVGGGYVQLIATTKGNPLLHPLGVYEGSSGFLPEYSSLTGFLAANPGWVVPYSYRYEPPAPQVPTPINGAPGIFNGGTMFIPAPEVLGGADADYVVIGWTGPYATYDAAYAADLANPNSSFLGMSAIATTQTGNAGVNPSTPVPLSLTFQGLTLAPAVIPEPTTVLLAGLGAVLLLLFRRRG